MPEAMRRRRCAIAEIRASSTSYTATKALVQERLPRLPRFETARRDGAGDAYLRQLVDEGAIERYGELDPEIRERIEHELDVIMLHGVRRLFPDRVGPDPVRARERDPGRARAGARRRDRSCRTALRITDLDPLRYGLHLRTVPEPGADPDAGHRHGLRRPPAGRGDPLRRREVRLGPRRADHHVPDDQGEAGDPGLGARARVPRERRGPPLQDVPAGGAGPRIPDRGAL